MPRLPVRMNAMGESLVPTPKVAVATVAREQTDDRQSNDLQRKSAAASQAARSSVLENHNLLQNQAFTAGAVTLINHGLGQPLTGVHCTMVNSGAPAPSFSKGTPPNGLDPAKVAALVCNVTGNYDLLVFA